MAWKRLEDTRLNDVGVGVGICGRKRSVNE